MRMSTRLAVSVVFSCAWGLSASTPASEFAEHMAAWNAGPTRGRVAPVAYEEPAVSRTPTTKAPIPATQSVPRTSHWQQEAFGHGNPYYAAATGPACSDGSCGLGSCGPGCGAGSGGYQGCDMCCGKPLWWAKLDVLLWWRQGRDLPPLVTTDPIDEGSDTAGVLPDATILFGGGRESSQMAVGGRFDVGFWMDPNQCWGIGNRFFGLGRDSASFQVDSLDNPVLAIPFFNSEIGENDALLVASPGVSTGAINIDATSEVMGNDVYARFLICRDCNSRLDFITGYHFSRINDDLRIRSQSVTTEVGGNIPIGTVTDVLDRFDARNEFHGAILGLMHEIDCRCWTIETLAKMSIGGMHERVIIDGSTRIAVPGEDPTLTEGGLFTGDSNLGEFNRSEFTAVTEVGLKLAYKWGPCTRLSVGYSFIYWNDVLRPGDHIDPRVGESSTGDVHPRFSFNHGDYWVQGINLGLVREF
jgi:hypothetical protein